MAFLSERPINLNLLLKAPTYHFFLPFHETTQNNLDEDEDDEY